MRKLALLALLLQTACGTQPASRDDSLSGITLTAADAGKSIAVELNAVITLSLKENPGTGYVWTIEDNNARILEVLSSGYTPASAALIGGGGWHDWRFKARESGDALLALKRWRQWEGDKSTLERFNITLHVGP